ncbi:MAG: VWA domain-containing protein, partial [Methanosarcinales archaeon]
PNMIQFENLYIIAFIIPIIAVLIYSIKNKKNRYFIFSRGTIFLLLLFAFASPYTFEERTVQDESPRISVIMDKTDSMELFKELNKTEFPTDSIYYISGNKSGIGDAIVQYANVQDNILLISDGNNNYGKNLMDAIVFAQQINTTVYLLKLNPIKKDIIVHSVGNTQWTVSVWIDDKLVLTKQSQKSSMIPIKHTFNSVGSHTIKAQISSNEDYFSENNVFYKSVYVIPKPNLLIVSNYESPLYQVLTKIYQVTKTNSLASAGALNKYSAIFLDNININDISDNEIEILSDYVNNGGGLVVVGGDRSYDNGGYDNTLLESLIPVKSGEVSASGKSVGVVIVIDISGSVGHQYGKDTKISMEKALAIGVLRDIGADDYVGVIAFRKNAYIVSKLTRGLYKTDIEEKIKKLKHGGTTYIYPAQLEAEKMLENFKGSKYVIIISDGKLTKKSSESLTINKAKEMANSGITTYAVGVGADTNSEFMKNLASAGNGIYFKPEETQRLKIVFGEKEETPKEEKKGLAIFALNPNHFITRGIDLNAVLTGYNKVIAKSGAQTLVTTEAGNPIVTVWRFGLGRVVSFTTDDGRAWSGQVYTKPNSILISKITNWAIGDPERNALIKINAPDAYQGETVDIAVTSDTLPNLELDGKSLRLSKTSENTYHASFNPTKTGFYELSGGYKIAVNYPLEYKNLGYNEELIGIVSATGGEVYDESQLDNIKELLLKDIKKKSTKTIQKKVDLKWPFILFALSIFLIEVLVRRIKEIQKVKSE